MGNQLYHVTNIIGAPIVILFLGDKADIDPSYVDYHYALGKSMPGSVTVKDKDYMYSFSHIAYI